MVRALEDSLTHGSNQIAMSPPSTGIAAPVMNEASSEHRNATTVAISDGSAARDIGSRSLVAGPGGPGTGFEWGIELTAMGGETGAHHGIRSSASHVCRGNLGAIDGKLQDAGPTDPTAAPGDERPPADQPWRHDWPHRRATAWPPSTRTTVPVVKLDASLARNSAAPTISSGEPPRRSG